jgi:hypothetical protein
MGSRAIGPLAYCVVREVLARWLFQIHLPRHRPGIRWCVQVEVAFSLLDPSSSRENSLTEPGEHVIEVYGVTATPTENMEVQSEIISHRRGCNSTRAAYRHAWVSNDPTIDAMDGSGLPGEGWLTSAPEYVLRIEKDSNAQRQITDNHGRHTTQPVHHGAWDAVIYPTNLRVDSKQWRIG